MNQKIQTLIADLDSECFHFVKVTATEDYVSKVQFDDPAKVTAVIQRDASKELEFLKSLNVPMPVDELILSAKPPAESTNIVDLSHEALGIAQPTGDCCYVCVKGEGGQVCIRIPPTAGTQNQC